MLHGRGFFCFLLLLGFVAVEIAFLGRVAVARHSLGEAAASAFEAEGASFARSLVEASVDSAVEGGLREALALNLGPEETRNLVNARLAFLFSEMEKSYSNGILLQFEPEGKQLPFLNQNSAAFSTKVLGKGIEAEYCFTGGVMRTNGVAARIAVGRAIAFFKIPAGYTVRVLEIA